MSGSDRETPKKAPPEDWGFDDVEPVTRSGGEPSPAPATGHAAVVPAGGDAPGAGTPSGGPATGRGRSPGRTNGVTPSSRAPRAAAPGRRRSVRRLSEARWFKALGSPLGRTILTALFFALYSLLLAFPYFGFGSMSFVVLHDTAEMNLPRSVWFGQGDALTGLSSWLPMQICGTDRLASGLSTDFSLLLFTTLPGWLAYGLLMWLQRFIAGYFLYRLLREWRQVAPAGAAAVACAYALFTQPHINMAWAGFALYDGLALPGLPLLLYLLYRSAGWRPRYRYAAAVGGGLLLAYTSHFFLAFFCVLVACLVVLVAFPRRDRRYFWVAPLVLAAAWLVGELPVLWAAAANAGLSHRGDRGELVVSEGLSGSGAWLPRFLADNALALALSGLAIGMAILRRSWRVLALAGVTVACLLVVAFSPELRDGVFVHLGPLSGFRFDRVFVVLPFLLLLTGGLGLGMLPRWSPSFEVRRLPGQYRVPVRALAGAVLLVAIVVQAGLVQARIGDEMAKGATYASLYESPQIAGLAGAQKATDLFRVASVNAPLGRRAGETWHAGYAWAYGLETADGYSVLYSQRYQDYWLRVIDADVGRSDEIERHFERWGNRVYLFTSRNYLANPLGLQADKRWNLALLSLANVRYLISPVKLRHESLTLRVDPRRDEQLAWLELPLDARRRIVAEGGFPGLPLYVYENAEVLPRAFLAGESWVVAGEGELLAELAAAPVERLRSAAFLTPDDAATLGLGGQPTGLATIGGETVDEDAEPPAESPGEVRVSAYEADGLRLRVSAERRAVLIVTDSYAPYWRARIDGEETPVAPVDHTFLGVVVPDGTHEVILEYRPPYRFLFWQ